MCALCHVPVENLLKGPVKCSAKKLFTTYAKNHQTTCAVAPGNYLFKVNNNHNRTRQEICSKLS